MPLQVGVALAWSPLRIDVDALDATVTADPRLHGLSAADESALEWALRLAETWAGQLVAATAGPAGADTVLREALGRGAWTAVRVETALDAPPALLATALDTALAGCDVVLTGTWSPRRGSGAVPALLAARRSAAQALGLLDLYPEAPGQVVAVRRLDGGRRERLRVTAPCVLSVDAGTAPLRRASLAGVVAARTLPVRVLPGPPAPQTVPAPRRSPMRPRPRAARAPDRELSPGQRIRALTGVDRAARIFSQPVVLSPAEAADRLLDALRSWGYRP